ncbi:HTH domain-containing protein [Streptomyces sp. S.PB5]|uniref:HTH domain-containing protein n=1 Tax=Streptomyces sp. S.PB5 TaxID=3020844 RepID=UPI0025AFA4E0|nr:HTH domain-containing protein [Streptomyces sp. S.PB5]MDN3021562.1 HTH domain-containing protein [Streptomyces sp. S.PB5]
MTRADRLTLVRQLHEEGLSRREIGKRLKVSKDTVRRDLDRIKAEDESADAPPGEPDEADAPQASEAAAEDSAPGDEPPGEPVAQEADDRAPQAAPPAAPVAEEEPVRPVLRIDLVRRPRLLRNLAALLDLGLKAPAVIDMAVAAFTDAYRHALARGELRPGEPYEVRTRVRPAAAVRRAV